MLRKIVSFTAKAVGLLVATLAGLWLFGERGHLMLPSTRRYMDDMGGWKALLTMKFWDGYAYMRWSNQYIGWNIKHTFRFFQGTPDNEWWAPIYHGKVLRTEDAKRLISVEQDIPRQTLEQVIPYEIARDIVLEGDPAIALYDCPCRSARENPCSPTEVCMIVGEPWVDFVMEHNQLSARRVTKEEAAAVLEAEHERGHLHAAYFKDVMNERFYAICNCCSCCCGGIDAMVNHNIPMVMSSGYVAQFDEMQCTGCGNCEDACPFGAVEVNGHASLIWDNCLGCGICQSQCTNEAITLVLDERKGQPLDVRKLVKN